MPNQGNDCFINAAFQAIIDLPHLPEFFLKASRFCIDRNSQWLSLAGKESLSDEELLSLEKSVDYFGLAASFLAFSKEKGYEPGADIFQSADKIRSVTERWKREKTDSGLCCSYGYKRGITERIGKQLLIIKIVDVKRLPKQFNLILILSSRFFLLKIFAICCQNMRIFLNKEMQAN